MSEPRLIETIINEITEALKEIKHRYDKDCHEEVLSCKEAAYYMKRTDVTISRYISQGKLKKVHINGKTGVLKSDCRKLLK